MTSPRRFQLRWHHYLFGVWGLLGALASSAAILFPPRAFFPELHPKALILPIFVGFMPPFIQTILLLNRIGLNVGDESSKAEKQIYLRRCRETWKTFPITASLFLLAFPLPFLMLIPAMALWPPDVIDSVNGCVGGFYALPAFVNLRLLRSGGRLMAQWQREDKNYSESEN